MSIFIMLLRFLAITVDRTNRFLACEVRREVVYAQQARGLLQVFLGVLVAVAALPAPHIRGAGALSWYFGGSGCCATSDV